jgi:hypothetical protein
VAAARLARQRLLQPHGLFQQPLVLGPHGGSCRAAVCASRLATMVSMRWSSDSRGAALHFALRGQHAQHRRVGLDAAPR